MSFGIGVITPRWLYVLASATPAEYGEPRLIDETLESFDVGDITPGDVVGIGIHTGNALRGYEIGTAARAAGADVVFGGIHATLYADEAREHGGAHAVVSGVGEYAWPAALRDCAAGKPNASYDGGRTMEAAEDPEFLDAMRRAHIKGALVGVESVTAEGLKDVYSSLRPVGAAHGDSVPATLCGSSPPTSAGSFYVDIRDVESNARDGPRLPTSW